jgi:hypothetical protein
MSEKYTRTYYASLKDCDSTDCVRLIFNAIEEDLSGMVLFESAEWADEQAAELNRLGSNISVKKIKISIEEICD